MGSSRLTARQRLRVCRTLRRPKSRRACGSNWATPWCRALHPNYSTTVVNFGVAANKPLRDRELASMEERQQEGRRRVVIERVSPEIDCGRFGIKRVVGESVVVEADVFADGHDQVACQVLYGQGANALQSSPMTPLGNDRWRGTFPVESLGCYRYTVEGWIDPFRTWLVALRKESRCWARRSRGIAHGRGAYRGSVRTSVAG
jgi:hypothetical protein